jgi:hypothetical protein
MKSTNEIYEQTIKWIRSGKIGCTFATILAKNPEKIGWKFQINPSKLEWDQETYLLSIIFPEGDIHLVRNWALDNGMYLENIDDLYQGLRLKIGDDISWVQYFGPDSHVLTRQSPYPMLNLCVKLPMVSYYKVGFKGVLHLAHASVGNFTKYISDKLWESSFRNTEKRLGHKPTIREAAKTTYIK